MKDNENTSKYIKDMLKHPKFQEVRLLEVPVFVRSGAVLAKKMRRRRSSLAMAGDPYTLVVYGEKAQGQNSLTFSII